MSDTRISAADLLRLAAIASVSPEGSSDEVVAILQRTGPAEPTLMTEIDGSQIKTGSITAEKIAANAIQTQHMAPGSIAGDRIISGSATIDQLSVTAANLTGAADDADSDKLAKPE